MRHVLHVRFIDDDFIQLSGVPREIPDLTDDFLAELSKPENNTRGRSVTKESGESEEQSDEEEGCLSEGDDDRPPKSHAMLGVMGNQFFSSVCAPHNPPFSNCEI